MTEIPAVVYLKPEVPRGEKRILSDEEKSCSYNNLWKRCKAISHSQKKLESYKMLLEALNSAVVQKFDQIDEKLDSLSENCIVLEDKVKILSSRFETTSTQDLQNISIGSVEQALILPESKASEVLNASKSSFITANAEDDFPNGSWLGFTDNPEMRVRCNISPKNLQTINTKCNTPLKMALTLLNCFSNLDTQACSTINGPRKHKKKNIDPLLIYGIKCHLIYRFKISEDDWTKIKKHIDRRKAFRKRMQDISISYALRSNLSFTELAFL